jgi:hypothetical protein
LIFVFNKIDIRMTVKMVLEHQNILQNLPPQGLPPSALQLYAAAAQFAQRSRVPPWAPFLQFGVPGVFGGPFLVRPRFGPPTGHPGLAGIKGINGFSNGDNEPFSSLSPQCPQKGPPSEDSNDDNGK